MQQGLQLINIYQCCCYCCNWYLLTLLLLLLPSHTTIKRFKSDSRVNKPTATILTMTRNLRQGFKVEIETPFESLFSHSISQSVNVIIILDKTKLESPSDKDPCSYSLSKISMRTSESPRACSPSSTRSAC